MGDVKSVIPAIKTAVEALATSPTRLADDFRAHHALTAGQTYYQLVVEQLGEGGTSEAKLARAGVTLRIVHRLATPSNPRAYTEAAMLDDQQILFKPDWWIDLSGVWGASDPRSLEEVQLVGAVVVYAIQVQLEIPL